MNYEKQYMKLFSEYICNDEFNLTAVFEQLHMKFISLLLTRKYKSLAQGNYLANK